MSARNHARCVTGGLLVASCVWVSVSCSGSDNGGTTLSRQPRESDSPIVDLPEPVNESADAAGVVDRGDYEGNPRAEAAASFYEELWSSYRSGDVSTALSGLMTGAAATYFNQSVAEVADKGEVLHSLSEAEVVKVDGAVVHICMAAVSTQNLDAETGEPAESPDQGDLEYVVDLVRQGGDWLVAQTRGFEDAQCGGDG